MCVCTCAYVCVCAHVCMHVCVHVHVCAHLCMHVCVSVSMCMCVYDCVSMCVCVCTLVCKWECTFAMACMWRSKNSLRCRSLPSKIGSFMVPRGTHWASWSEGFWRLFYVCLSSHCRAGITRGCYPAVSSFVGWNSDLPTHLASILPIVHPCPPAQECISFESRSFEI